MKSKAIIVFVATYGLLAAIGSFAISDEGIQTERPLSYIVQARSTEAASAAVKAVGGEIVVTLDVIRAVGATLTAAEVATLRAADSITIYVSQDNRS